MHCACSTVGAMTQCAYLSVRNLCYSKWPLLFKATSTEATGTFRLCYMHTVLLADSVISKNKGTSTSSGTLSETLKMASCFVFFATVR